MLDSGSANWLAAVGARRRGLGIAAADISTGRFELVACGPGELARRAGAAVAGRDHRRRASARASPRRAGKGGFDSLAGERALKARFGVATLDGFGAFGRAELAAAGGLLAYLDATQKDAAAFLAAPRRIARAEHMAIDAATRDSLEICRTPDGQRRRQPARRIDRCVTGAGRAPARRRSVRAADRSPRDRGAARAGRNGCTTTPLRRERVRDALKAMPDIGRALGRLVAGRGSPRDLAPAARRPRRSAALHGRARSASRTGPTCSTRCCPTLGGHGALTDRLAARAGRLAAARRGARAAISPRAMTPRSTRCAPPAATAAARSPRWRRATARRPASPTLKIRHNAVLGYHIEVRARHADRLMAPDSGFTHRQTLAGVVRFNSPDLHDEASRVVEAGAHALAAEAAHFEELTALAVAAAPRDRRHRRRDRPDRRRRRAMPSARPRAAGACRTLDRPAVPRDRGRPPSGGRGGAGATRASASSPTIARSARATGCG